MNERQRRFLELYSSGLTPDEAATEAGYKNPGFGQRLLQMTQIKNALLSTTADNDENRIADSSEILRMLTSVMRGDVHDPVVVVEQRTGKEGKTERRARVIKKSASVKERMSAAEMLARRYGILDGSEEESGVLLFGEEKILSGEIDDIDFETT